MTFIYFCHNTLQIPRVARQCMVGLCEGMSDLDVATEIVSPQIRLHSAEQTHPALRQLYQVSNRRLRFQVYRIPLCSDDKSRWFAAFRLAAYSFHFLKRAMFYKGEALICSARNYSVLAMLVCFKDVCSTRIIVLADVHGFVDSRLAKWVHRRVDANICISGTLATKLRCAFQLPVESVAVAHSGVKLSRFSRRRSCISCEEMGLSPRIPTVFYAGKVFYPYEEIRYIITAAKILRDQVQFVIVGGRPDQIPPWESECRKAGIDNVKFTGFVEPVRIPDYLKLANLLVMYYSPSPLNDFRSPGKLFEYLASGIPLIGGRFKGIEEIVVHGVNGFLVEPYKPELLAEGIRDALNARDLWPQIGKNAVATATRYSWTARAQRFLDAAKTVLAIREGREVYEEDRLNHSEAGVG